MKQLTNLVSEVGSPSPINPVTLPKEIKKGAVIDGWIAPYTMLSPCPNELFRAFGLWQSSNGLCKPGPNHVSLNRWTQTVHTTHPVLAGDQVDGKAVWRAVNSYNSNTRIWTVAVVWGAPPLPLAPKAEDYAYLEALLKQAQTQADATLAMLDDFFTQVVANCLCPPGPAGGPLITAVSQPLWESIKAQYEQKVQKPIDDMEDKQWQLF